MATTTIIPTIDYTSYDFNSLTQQMVNQLVSQPNSAWKDTYRSGAGQMMVELSAFIGDLLMYYAERRANEVYIGTAQLPSSLLNVVRLLGYQPYRQTSATGTCTFYCANAVANQVFIPQWTQLQSAAGVQYLTYDPSGSGYVLQPTANLSGNPIGAAGGVAVPVVQGSLVTVSNTSPGLPLQTITIPDITIENNLLFVNVVASDGTSVQWGQVNQFVPPNELLNLFQQFPQLKDLLFQLQPGLPQDLTSFVQTFSSSQVYQVIPLVAGGVTIQFGDGTFGAIPPVGSKIVVTYVSSAGADGNIFSDAGGNITTITQMGDGSQVPTDSTGGPLLVNNGVYQNGEWTGGSFLGGSAAETTTSIRYNAPRVFKTGDRAVTKDDFNALLLTYPGIDSAFVWGEAESLATPDPTMANTIGIVLVAGETDSVTGLTDFVDPASLNTSANFRLNLINYLRTKSVISVLYNFQSPMVIDVVPVVSLHVTKGYSLTAVAQNVTAALRSQFVLGETTLLGTPIRLSEIYAAVQAVAGVDHCRIDLYANTPLLANGSGNFSFSVQTPLPPGLTFSSSTATISGTPTTAGTYEFNVVATDKLGTVVTQGYTLVIVSASGTPETFVLPGELPQGKVGAYYSAAVLASGDNANLPIVYTLSPASIPAPLLFPFLPGFVKVAVNGNIVASDNGEGFIISNNPQKYLTTTEVLETSFAGTASLASASGGLLTSAAFSANNTNIVPGSVSMTDGTNTVTDNGIPVAGVGNLLYSVGVLQTLGTVVGTITYATGTVAVTSQSFIYPHTVTATYDYTTQATTLASASIYPAAPLAHIPVIAGTVVLTDSASQTFPDNSLGRINSGYINYTTGQISGVTVSATGAVTAAYKYAIAAGPTNVGTTAPSTLPGIGVGVYVLDPVPPGSAFYLTFPVVPGSLVLTASDGTSCRDDGNGNIGTAINNEDYGVLQGSIDYATGALENVYGFANGVSVNATYSYSSTLISGEAIGSAVGAGTMIAASTAFAPIVPGTLTLTDNSVPPVSVTDNGFGSIGNGTINYVTGAIGTVGGFGSPSTVTPSYYAYAQTAAVNYQTGATQFSLYNAGSYTDPVAQVASSGTLAAFYTNYQTLSPGSITLTDGTNIVTDDGFGNLRNSSAVIVGSVIYASGKMVVTALNTFGSSASVKVSYAAKGIVSQFAGNVTAAQTVIATVLAPPPIVPSGVAAGDVVAASLRITDGTHYVADDGLGNLKILNISTSALTTAVGTINYLTGVIVSNGTSANFTVGAVLTATFVTYSSAVTAGFSSSEAAGTSSATGVAPAYTLKYVPVTAGSVYLTSGTLAISDDSFGNLKRGAKIYATINYASGVITPTTAAGAFGNAVAVTADYIYSLPNTAVTLMAQQDNPTEAGDLVVGNTQICRLHDTVNIQTQYAS